MRPSRMRSMPSQPSSASIWIGRPALPQVASAAEKLDAKLKLELHWLQRGVTARRRRNQGRLAKLHQMRAVRAAMLGPAGTARIALENDEVRSKSVIVAEHVTKRFGERT